ncbi:Mitochondrial-processing peptidase subunit alpha, partial [Nowakowskiella sp. JEL0078]
MLPSTEEQKNRQLELSHPTKYTGGSHIYSSHLDPPPPNPDTPILTHIYIAFESLSVADPDIYALATLASLMGGGGSFSAGGPGKGMHTRLYTKVLNRHYWVENCTTINFSYADTGLFGLNFSVSPGRNAHAQAISVMISQLFEMQRVSDSELARAKNQLKSNLLMGLESKMVEIEDIGRQVLMQNSRIGVGELCRRIDTVTAADVKRVVERVILGSDEKSPLNFGEVVGEKGSLLRHWKRSGDGRPTVVVHGPLGERDALKGIEWALKDAGVGGDKWLPTGEKGGSWVDKIMSKVG